MSGRLSQLAAADLLRALHLAAADAAAADRLAAVLGYAPRPDAAAEPVDLTLAAAQAATEPSVTTASTAGRQPLRPPLRGAYPALTRLEQLQPAAGQAPPQMAQPPLTAADCQPLCPGQPPLSPLVALPRLWPAVRRSLQTPRPAGVDLPRLVGELARARPLPRLPQRQRPQWSGRLTVIWDVGDSMQPYYRDFARFYHWLLRWRGGAGLRLVKVYGDPWQILDATPAAARVIACDSVLLLSDLGALAAGPQPAAQWRHYLRELRRAGAVAVAWAPHAPRQTETATAGLARLYCLHRAGNLHRQRGRLRDAGQRRREHLRLAALREQLLRRLACCVRLEPELLRAIRRLYPPAAAEPGLEGMVWAFSRAVTGGGLSRPLRAELQGRYRAGFAALPAGEQQALLAAMLHCHQYQGRSTQVQETLVWDSHANAVAAAAMAPAVEQARVWLAGLDASQRSGPAAAREVAEFAADLLARNAGDSGFHARYAAALAPLYARAGLQQLPPGLDPLAVAAARAKAGDASYACEIWQSYQGLVLHWRSRPAPLPAVSRIGGPFPAVGGVEKVVDHGQRHWLDLQASNGYLARPGQSLQLVAQGRRYHIEMLRRPAWADNFGRDYLGLFADLRVETGHGRATQRLRWIEPGVFRMGSPPTEPERYDNETPHRVTLSRGFWLADTACTQALWQAVTGNNPSYFNTDPQHPVERVSWDDVQQFLLQLNALCPGLTAGLPTEAQWEYACRAGTDTPFSFGANIGPEQVNYNSEYPYNGGAKGQYRGTTVPVCSLPPNPWGLYEMHGNVWEWCEDWYGAYPPGAQTDPSGPDIGAGRVLRGGSWLLSGRDCRAACRFSFAPGLADVDVGFRLSRGQ